MSRAVQRVCFVFLPWLFGALPQPTLADEHIVIEEGAFERLLSNRGAIAEVAAGIVMDIRFHYQDYSPLHPYLIAQEFCVADYFIIWDSASSSSQDDIHLVCIKKSQDKSWIQNSRGG